ncbi:MAG: hypothetical protein IT581_06365 [Verrucomicrobiales bacterium]|nr:hypothetical protein [Verrucomicrobiales bacterium]
MAANSAMRCLAIVLGLSALPVIAVRGAAPIEGYLVDFPDAPLPIYNVGTNGPPLPAGLVAFDTVALVTGGSGISNVDASGGFTPDYPKAVSPSGKTAWLLTYSAFGHTITGDRPDLSIGDAFPTPQITTNGSLLQVDWDAMLLSSTDQTLFSSTDDAFIWVEEARQAVYAAQGGTMKVAWILTNSTTKATTRTFTYNVASAPTQRPSRAFWTERGYNAPQVDLRGKFVRLHFNTAIQPPIELVTTNINGVWSTNIVQGVWVDPSSSRLRVDPGTNANFQGMIVMQYFTTAAMDQQVSDGVVVIEIAKPEVNLLPAVIGQRVLPEDNPYGTNGLIAQVTQNGNGPPYVYQHKGQYSHSPKDGWVFPIRASTNAPWNMELYWEEADFMGTVWPYERDWYAADWPDASQMQVFIRGTGDFPGPDVFIPASLGPQLQDYQDPPGHVQPLNAGVFRTSVDGSPGTGGLYRSLLKFSGQNDQGSDDVWFQAVQSVPFTDVTFAGYRSRALPWPIGTEIVPVSTNSLALAFDGMADRAEVIGLGAVSNFTFTGWFQSPGASDGLLKPILARRVDVDLLSTNGVSLGSTNDLEWMLAIDTNATVSVWVRTAAPSVEDPALAVLRSTQPLTDNAWHTVTGSVATVTTSGATHLQMTLQIDGGLPYQSRISLSAPRPSSTNTLYVGTDGAGAFFRGKLDDLRIGSPNLRPASLILQLPMTGWVSGDTTNDPPQLADVGGSQSGVVQTPVFGAELVSPGAPALRQVVEANISTNHNYIFQTNSVAPFNPSLYVAAFSTNTAPESYVFGVNSGQIEVWWMQSMQQDGMTVPVYFPALPQVYTNVWPVDAAPIVLASGLGAPPIQAVDPPIIYAQTDLTANGFNPNEEHALVADGGDGWVTYALRNDLNDTSLPDSSEPYVLVQYVDPVSGTPNMAAFRVVRTNLVYPVFAYNAVAGNPIKGPAPLNLLPGVMNTFVSSGPGWEDRTLTWWAVGAGAGLNGTDTVVMHPYYPQQAGFWFPGLPASYQPAQGTAIPWLPVNGPGPSSNPTYPTRGTPVAVDWIVSWPSDVPTMQVGQTLTNPTGGLPDVRDQLSVDVVYQQSTNAKAPFSSSHPILPAVTLFDPTQQRTNGLGIDLFTLGFKFGNSSAPGYVYDQQGLVYFRGLPPDLSERFYYDPVATNLVLIGQTSETTPSYLLINALSAGQVAALKGLGSNTLDPASLGKWQAAIDGLPTTVLPIVPNQPFDHAAIAAIGTGAGYVTLAFNNATNVAMGVQPGDPISLSVIRVETNLFSGFVVPLEDPVNLLSDQMNILFSESLGGAAGAFQFEWVSVEPLSNGSVPMTLTSQAPFDPNGFLTYTNGGGLTRLLIGGDGATLEDMVDRFFVTHYRASTNAANYSDLVSVVGTNWSVPTAWNLAEGWVQRVLNALTPFELRLRDLSGNPVETWGTMLQQAGPPYEGPVALNMNAIESVGLIQLYSTVRDRALGFYTNSPVQPPDAAANQQLQLAASRLHAMYMMLGNEAYADAMDPTVAFGSVPALASGGLPGLDFGALASSLYCFENQVPSLLDEELALLRGRGDPDSAPGVGTSPYYNRLYWNFTKGIDAGEVAYAVNYNIHDPDAATLSAGTAMQLYPQGHGDAWGHYLSALGEYLHLLSLPGFQWGGPQVLPMLLDPEALRYVIETGVGNEQRVAEASAALVRTGVEIIRRGARKAYLADRVQILPGSVDAVTDRAWGVSEWVSRAGSAAFYSWALSQSLLPPEPIPDTNSVDASLLGLNRGSVPALDEIVAGYRSLQEQADAIDQGLNPLGMAAGAMPFDISPVAVDSGQTHYEQIYQRALVALQNAASALSAAQNAGRLLRQQSESALQFKQAMEGQEADFNTQLIALYGYPYPADIGPAGTYPQGYDGPDLFHYAYVDLEALGFDPRTEIGASLMVTNFNVSKKWLDKEGKEFRVTTATNQVVTFHFAANGLLDKPSNWVLPRRAEGRLQQAYRAYLSAVLAYRSGVHSWINNIGALESSYHFYHQDDGWHDNQSAVLKANEAVAGVNLGVASADLLNLTITTAVDAYLQANETVLEPSKWALPFSLIGGLADGGDVFSEARAGVAGVMQTQKLIATLAKDAKELLLGVTKLGATAAAEALRIVSAKASFKIADEATRAGIVSQANAVDVAGANLLVLIEAMEQAQQQFVSLTAQGEQLQAERARVRTVAASELAQGRYHDMAFRIFRNDALGRYGEAFELASRYAYLAAAAYDFETCLLAEDPNLDSSATPGSVYAEQIVRARTIGVLNGGQPVIGAGSGDPGLADVLARMDANWQVLKGRLGFNNPDQETSYFSLRTDLFNILLGADGDSHWRTNLSNPIYRVDNLLDHPVFRNHCLPFASQEGLQTVEPGLVIPFSTSVNFGENFFGKPLAAGQNSYDSSHFATKIRGVGVWFTGYDGGTNDTEGVLANQPRVYLIPTGLDYMRSPSGDGTALRSWQVVDQAIPMPFPVGDELNNRDWIPIHDSLPGPWAQARRHASLRAYQDHGFNLEELTYNSRLVGRSVWNTQWYLIIPAGTLGSDREAALNAFLQTVTDIKLYFQTYSYSGN